MEKCTLVFEDMPNGKPGQIPYALLKDGTKIYFDRIIHRDEHGAEYLGKETFNIATGVWSF